MTIIHLVGHPVDSDGPLLPQLPPSSKKVRDNNPLLAEVDHNTLLEDLAPNCVLLTKAASISHINPNNMRTMPTGCPTAQRGAHRGAGCAIGAGAKATAPTWAAAASAAVGTATMAGLGAESMICIAIFEIALIAHPRGGGHGGCVWFCALCAHNQICSINFQEKMLGRCAK